MNKNIQNDQHQRFEDWKHFICSGNKRNRKQNCSIKPTSKFPVKQQIHKMCFSIRCWEWKYLETSWWKLVTIVCLNCYLIFVSHAELAWKVPELDYALICDKPVNPNAAASPDVPPWHLCRSIVYIPLRYTVKIKMWWQLRHLMAIKLQKCKWGKILLY